MISKPVENPIVAVSVRVYQALLVAYPTSFQQEYGSHMAQVFRDCCLRAARQGGMRGLVTLWAITFIDLLSSALAEHLQKENEMTRSKFIKLSGWAFVFGSFALIKSMSGSSLGMASLVISSILLTTGIFGLRTRYGENVGGFGRNILLVGVVGMVLAYAATPIFRNDEKWFLVPLAAHTSLMTSLAVFGLVALIKKPLPHVNWLPLFAGILFPALYLPALFFILNNDALPDGDIFWKTFSIILSLQFLGLCILGFILQTDAPVEVHAPA